MLISYCWFKFCGFLIFLTLISFVVVVLFTFNLQICFVFSCTKAPGLSHTKCACRPPSPVATSPSLGQLWVPLPTLRLTFSRSQLSVLKYIIQRELESSFMLKS